MKKEQIEQINAAAKKCGDLDQAICEFLDLAVEHKQAGGVPPGAAGAVYNIRFEVEQWNAADKETRAGIEAFKAAKEHVSTAPVETAPAKPARSRRR